MQLYNDSPKTHAVSIVKRYPEQLQCTLLPRAALRLTQTMNSCWNEGAIYCSREFMQKT